jgi:tRNA pseudouridine38-40 synthase
LRYFIEFSYKGTKYHGWQSQPNASSVQQTLTEALCVLLHSKIELMGAGRTDTGVHARQMFAHFDTDVIINPETLVHKLNSYLPADIAVYDIIEVHADAHARFDATARTYEYHIHAVKDPFLFGHSWFFRNKLDVAEMNKAAKILFEYEDFQCFSKSNTDVFTYNCRIHQAEWTSNGNRLIFTITADRFLRNMVRAIVGTMVNIGSAKIRVQDLRSIIESKDRRNAGFSVPAEGLYLTEIQYPFIASNNK